MAKSKQHKRRQRLTHKVKPEQVFFESLPMAGPMVMPLPSLKPPIDAKTAAQFGKALWFDLWRILGWLKRFIWNRRTRAVYLALIAAGTLTVVIAGVTIATSTYSVYAGDLSSPATLLAKKQVGTTILDRNGNLLYEAYGAQHTTAVPLAQLPSSLQQATLAAEDPNFYSEPGFSWRGTARAAVVDITHMGKVEGGSTLTQQLIKNSVLTSDKSFTRKFKELVLATDLEQKYSKNQIIEMYLNDTYYGQGAYGIEAAAQTYFHTSASKLTLSQSALIAGLPLGPSRFDPNADLGAATDRRNYVLDRMQSLGKITPAQDKAAKAEPVVAFAQSQDIKAPWFVFYVLKELTDQYGKDAVMKGGLVVQTTLDLTKEEAAENIVAGQISQLGSHNVTNGALVSTNPKNGDIIAMVGSADYNAPGWGAFNVAADGLRQPGSSFKPFAYLTAFAKGWTGATTIVDAPVSIPLPDGTVYSPQNYDLRYHGTVTVRTALDNSLNIPAVKTLQFAGISDTIKTATVMGLPTIDAQRNYVPSLVLGTGSVTPLEMATAYGTIATGGTKVPARSIIKVSDRNGKDITKPVAAATTGVIDSRYAYMMTNILSDNKARQPEFPFNSPLRITAYDGTEIPAAAKTGTTQDFRDNWTVGYTPDVVTAVWVGNSNNTPMSNVDGITGAAPIWHDYMETVLAGQPINDFAEPTGLISAKVCLGNGGLANPWDTNTTTEVFPSAELPTAHCNTLAPTPIPTPLPVSTTITNILTTPVATPPKPRSPNAFGF